MRKPVAGVLTACLMGSAAVAQGAPAGESARTLITNVRVWDGTSTRLGGATNVLIEGNQILESSAGSAVFSGISVQDNSNRNNIRDNIMRRGPSSTRHGVLLFNGADGNVIASNDMRDGSVLAPISDGGTNTVITGNLP